MLNFWIRLATSKISFALYQHTKTLFDNGELKSDLLANIKSSLDQIQFSHLWDTPQEELSPEFLKLQFNLNCYLNTVINGLSKLIIQVHVTLALFSK